MSTTSLALFMSTGAIARVTFRFPLWSIEVATRKGPPGRASFVTIHPGVAGLEFIPGKHHSKPALTIREGQIEYLSSATDRCSCDLAHRQSLVARPTSGPTQRLQRVNPSSTSAPKAPAAAQNFCSVWTNSGIG
jgi:hypothetical protein